MKNTDKKKVSSNGRVRRRERGRWQMENGAKCLSLRVNSVWGFPRIGCRPRKKAVALGQGNEERNEHKGGQ